MKNSLAKIIFIVLILSCLIGVVSASDNLTELQSFQDENSVAMDNENLINENDNKPSEIYINNSKEVSGDGLSPETAYKSFDYNTFDKVANNGTIYLSEGKYSIPDGGQPYNTNYNVVGQRGTIINSFWFDTGSYLNFNQTLTFINISFEVPSDGQVEYMTAKNNEIILDEIVHYGISLEGRNFNFINCTFVNTSFVSGQYQHTCPNRDTLTDICTASFENCKFLNYAYDPNVKSYDVNTSWGAVIPTKEYETTSLITSFECTKYIFNNCMFDNLTCDAIVDSYGGQSDSQGRVDGVYIYNSTFSNCNIHGIVKARQASYCIVSNCSYDFPVSNDIPLVGPFYINCTDRPVIKTNLDIVVNGNSLVISLTDELGKPLKDVEIEIVTNARVSYQYTDNEGKIVLSNLLGTYSFEISYPGDEYEGYAPASAVKNLTFKNNDSGNVTEDKNSSSKPATNNPSSSIKTTKVATKITAKKATFKAKKKTKKYTITLKSGKNPIKKVKVSLKVKGKTYKATTNAKGKATFKITKLNKKGTFTATVKFAGNKNFKATTKKVKIVVKK